MPPGLRLELYFERKSKTLNKPASASAYFWIYRIGGAAPSPYLASFPYSFSLSVICQAAQFLALSPPAQDPLDFSPAKELCTVPQLSSASLFPFLSL